MKKNGFTLIELIVTLAIITVVSVVMFTSLFGWKNQTDLVNVTKQVGALLREAASNAMTQENGTAWGVHFDNATNTTPFYALFASSTYSTSSVIGSYPLPASVGYLTSTFPVGSTEDIAFDPVSGDASASTSIGLYLLGDPTQSSTISVASTGAVSYLNPPVITYAGGYLHFRTITIDHTRVANTDQTNFPVLFSGTYPYLATWANGGIVDNSNGDDIIFASDAAGTNKLDFEQESYDPTTGKVNYWIRIPTLSHTQDTVIYMFYGDPNITTSQANPAGVWDSNYKGVWHLQNGTTITGTDSTSHGYTLTNNNSTAATTGKIDGAASFNGSNNYLSNTSVSISPCSSITVSYWNYVTTADVQGSSAFDVDGSYRIQAHSPWSDKTLYWDYGNYGRVSTDYTSYLNAWTYVTLEYNAASTTHTIYLNGAFANQTIDSSCPASTQTGLNIGAWPSNGLYHRGNIDEFRISTISRPAAWVATEYNNQSSPSTFYAVGSQNTP